MRIRQQFDKDKLFFTSDTHFFHRNIITYCNRPFENTRDMNNDIRDKWNSIVPKDGVVFHLGDVSLNSTPRDLNDLLYSLNGTIYLVTGNHESDALHKDVIKRWTGIYDLAEIVVEDNEITYGKQNIIMCHYPMIVWNGSHKGSWQLFGHVHGGLSEKGVTIKHQPTAMDVGVDCHNFSPISYQQVKEQITQQCLKGGQVSLKHSDISGSHC